MTEQPQPAPGTVLYLYHWRFPRGEEFGLFSTRGAAEARCDGKEGALVIDLLVIDETGNAAPMPVAAPGLALLDAEEKYLEAERNIDDYREALTAMRRERDEARADAARLRELLNEASIAEPLESE